MRAAILTGLPSAYTPMLSVGIFLSGFLFCAALSIVIMFLGVLERPNAYMFSCSITFQCKKKKLHKL